MIGIAVRAGDQTNLRRTPTQDFGDVAEHILLTLPSHIDDEHATRLDDDVAVDVPSFDLMNFHDRSPARAFRRLHGVIAASNQYS
jgi:hypothetical protein